VIDVQSFVYLGNIFAKLGPSSSGEEAYKEALMLVRAGFSASTFEEALLPNLLLGVATMCFKQEKYKEASDFYIEGLAVIPDASEGESWDVLRMKNRWFLGRSHWHQDRFLEGIKLMHLALWGSPDSAGVVAFRTEAIEFASSLLLALHKRVTASTLPDGCLLSDVAAAVEVARSIFEEDGQLEQQGCMLTFQGDCLSLMRDHKRALECYQLSMAFLPEHPFLNRCHSMRKIAGQYSLLQYVEERPALFDNAKAGKRVCLQVFRLIQERGDESIFAEPEVMIMRLLLQYYLAQFLRDLETYSSAKEKGEEKEKEQEKDWHGNRKAQRACRAHKQLARLILELQLDLFCVEFKTFQLPIMEVIFYWGPTNRLAHKPEKIRRFTTALLSKLDEVALPSPLDAWSIKLLCYKSEAERNLGMLPEAQKTLSLALDKATAASNIAAEEVQVLEGLADLFCNLNDHENLLKVTALVKEFAIKCGKPIEFLLTSEELADSAMGRKEEALLCAQQALSLIATVRIPGNFIGFGLPRGTEQDTHGRLAGASTKE